ncbi:hypothetical protein P5W99_38800 [Paraburkholderia sp. A3BS-1L]|uniref:hypothetical protein n=1 Tax=Paraburkholderia sp. A3BS-1L TaxID=3028375 RepID=UPI003DA91023
MSLKKAIFVGISTLFGVGAAGLARADQAPDNFSTKSASIRADAQVAHKST